jgi:hypothetical protein
VRPVSGADISCADPSSTTSGSTETWRARTDFVDTSVAREPRTSPGHPRNACDRRSNHGWGSCFALGGTGGTDCGVGIGC